MLIFLDVINPTNLTNLSDLTSEFRETSTVTVYICIRSVHVGPLFYVSGDMSSEFQCQRVMPLFALWIKCNVYSLFHWFSGTKSTDLFDTNPVPHIPLPAQVSLLELKTITWVLPDKRFTDWAIPDLLRVMTLSPRSTVAAYCVKNGHKMALYPAMMGYLWQWMFADPVAVNGSCTHFVWQAFATPIIVDSIAVPYAPCERAITFPFLSRHWHLQLVNIQTTNISVATVISVSSRVSKP